MADSGCEDTVPTISTMVPSCKLPEESDASMRARLFTSLSQSFPHSQLYKALHGGEDIILNAGDNSDDDDDSLYGDHLSNSCFASLRMDRRDSDDFDDDLRSLEWLQNEDLLKNIGGEKLDKEDDESEEQKENEDIKPDINLLQVTPMQPLARLQFLPQKHVNSKPPYSFSCLIFMAVEASPQKRLPVKDIYNWILTQFPYFQNAPTGWKNSVRHNLSLNKCFKKVEKDKGQSIGKGSLWCIDPAYRPNLLQALRKTPYHPYHQLQMTSTQPQNCIQYQSLPGGGRTILPLTQRPVPNTVSPHLFPFLSRRLAQTSFDVDNEMKDVAQTLVALKSSCRKDSPDSSSGEDTGPTWRHHKKSFRRSSSPVVVTGHPYNDHAYSSTRVLDDEEDDDDDVPSPTSSSIDEEYDFGDADEECDSECPSDMQWDSDDKDEVDGELLSNKKLKIDMPSDSESTSVSGRAAHEENEDDEQKKLHEGASALLDLAGLLINHHSNSSSPDASILSKKNDGDVVGKKRGGEKRSMSKKVKNEGKKLSPVIKREVEEEEEEESQRKRNMSKRKNAGNNGKYDREEYSLTKSGKASVRNLPENTNQPKSPKAKTPKSLVNVDTEKVSSPLSKSRSPSKTGTNRKHTKKGPTGKHKLKLSKTFGASSKLAASIGERQTSNTDGKADKIIVQNSVAKKGLSRKARNKKMQPLLLKKTVTTENVGTALLSVIGNVASESSKHTAKSGGLHSSGTKTSKVSEKPVTLKKKQLVNDDGIESDPRELCESSIDMLQTSALSPLVNGEISPAGDAPINPRESATASTRAEKVPDSRQKVPNTRQTSRLYAASDSSSLAKDSPGGDITRAQGSRKASTRNSSSSSSPSETAAVHKSPHFTRFSKKKAVLS